MTYIKSKQTNKQGGGWREGSADEGACCHARQPAFGPRSTWWEMSTTYFSLSSDLRTHSGLCAHKLTVTYTHN